MINRILIQKNQAINAIENGEFENSIIASKNSVVIILTQDWCPQWMDMKSWIYDLKIDTDVDIYELEYNTTDYSEDFMKFKENNLGNHYVPYLRFYKQGVLANETNYIDKTQFIDIIQNM